MEVDKLELVRSEREVVSYDIVSTNQNVDSVRPAYGLYKVFNVNAFDRVLNLHECEYIRVVKGSGKGKRS